MFSFRSLVSMEIFVRRNKAGTKPWRIAVVTINSLLCDRVQGSFVHIDLTQDLICFDSMKLPIALATIHIVVYLIIDQIIDYTRKKDVKTP